MRKMSTVGAEYAPSGANKHTTDKPRGREHEKKNTRDHRREKFPHRRWREYFRQEIFIVRNMPKSLSLFGRYLRQQNKSCRSTFRKYQITKLVPNGAAGRVPSASSQLGLWHNDDFNSYWRVSAFNTLFRKRTHPFNTMKTIVSERLSPVPWSVKVAPSALYALDDAGGFENYITRTPPQILRSNIAEKMRQVMYFMDDNHQVKGWNLPWKTFLRKRDRADPSYARYRRELRKRYTETTISGAHSRYSPYFLPDSAAKLFPQRDTFSSQHEQSPLNLWWAKSPEVESAFRRRLAEAKSFEEAFPDNEEPGAYRKGEGAGGGGGQGSPRPRSKIYRSRRSRPY